MSASRPVPSTADAAAALAVLPIAPYSLTERLPLYREAPIHYVAGATTPCRLGSPVGAVKGAASNADRMSGRLASALTSCATPASALSPFDKSAAGGPAAAAADMSLPARPDKPCSASRNAASGSPALDAGGRDASAPAKSVIRAAPGRAWAAD